MTYLDLFFILLILICGIEGISRGFVRTIALALSIFNCSVLSLWLYPFFHNLRKGNLSLIAPTIIVFIIFVIFYFFFGHIFQEITKSFKIVWLNSRPLKSVFSRK